MGRLGLYLFLADIILTAAAMISCLSTEDDDLRGLPRIGWIIIILLFSPVGAIVWFLAGRSRSPHAALGPFEGDRPIRTVAPDDDPDFLKRLDRDRNELYVAQQEEQEREMLRKWEEDLRRREDELRKRDKPEETA